MKIVLAFLFVFFVFSCAGTPKPGDGAQTEEENAINKTEEKDDLSVAEVIVSGQGEEQPEIEITDEPEIEFAQTDATPSTIPEESAIFAALPEPELHITEPPAAPVAEAAPSEATPPATTPSETAPSAAQPVVPPVQTAQPSPVSPPPVQTPPAPRPSPPVPPPALLGPAEEKPVQTAASTSDSPAVSVIRDEPPAPVPSRIAPPEKDDIIFSRTVRATVGQIVEIPFRGNLWLFMGELASRRGIVYDSRRLDPEGETFMFRTEEAGTYALRFYRQDFLRNYNLTDFVQVIVGEPPPGSAGWFNQPYDRGRVIAEPRWPEALAEAELRRTPARPPAASNESAAPAARPPSDVPSATVPPSNVPPADIPSVDVPSTASAIPDSQSNLPPEELLQKAKETFDEGKTAAAILLLDQYREQYPLGDELYWLYGQFYEANTSSRDILLALDYYRRLVREYPQSGRYNDARRRIAYLERFYINIQ
ncbi:MAG: hypothetical protein LBH44_14135 [Treponema sp.]|jgi:hypothetical protein|nr:hypothetical protein [Treponema sp.]